ncbi:MAG TPA: hypothetical protein VFE17_00250 [Candidatus Baltobacteraceae bacterium]|nr:hypothetical protein [Candidatus Baltobacteraceae bacterium]
MRTITACVICLLAAYLGVTAYAGYRVAQGIDNAKATSLVTRAGAGLMGRRQVERLAIRAGHVPAWITRSPSFWWTLHAAE